MAVEGSCVSLVIGTLLDVVIEEPPRGLLHWSSAKLFLLGVLIAPIVETVLFQLLPILVARTLGGRYKVSLAVSVILFAGVHFLEGMAVGIAAGIVGGFYLTSVFLWWVETSYWTAVWTTALSHMVRNSVAATMLTLLRAALPEIAL